MITKRAILAAMLAAAIGPDRTALAQSYPGRAIKIVVPFPAGGPTDLMARLLADRLSAALGQSVIVEDRPGGAGGSIGAKTVSTADPDGYTLLLCPTEVLTEVPLVFKNVDYDPIRGFAPIALIMSAPMLLVVTSAVPAKTLPELATYAKANPGKVRFGSPGFGTSPHVLGELFKSIVGADMIHVPYRGSAPAITDLLAGQVQMYIDTVTILLPHIEAGRVRAVAVMGDTPSSYLPAVPTAAAGGFPMLQATYTLGLYAPPGTPTAIIEKLNAVANEALTSTTVQAGLRELGAIARGGSVSEVTAYMAASAKTQAEIVAAAGIKPE